MKFICILCMAAFLSLSCGGGEPVSSCLAVVGGDSISVEEAAGLWANMPPGTRDTMLSDDSTSREFVRAVTVREMVELEVLRMGLDTLPEVISAGDSYGRLRSLTAIHILLLEEAAAGLDTEDLTLYRERMGRTAWYTLKEEGRTRTFGPEHLAEADPELGGYLMTMAPGEIVLLADGRNLTLDSMVVTDPELVEASAAHEDFQQFAVNRLVQVRAERALRKVLEEFIGYPPPLPDSAVIRSLSLHFSQGIPFQATDTVEAVTGFALTAGDLVGAVIREEYRRPVSPESETWLAALSIAVLSRQAAAVYLMNHHPGEFAIAFAGSDSVSMRAAVDILYGCFVVDCVQVTEDYLYEMYSELRGELTVPEKRTVLCVLLNDGEETAAFKEAVLAGTANALAGQLRGPLSTSAGGSDQQLSRPLMVNEIPSGLGPALFQLDAGDTTTWLGPAPYAPELCWITIRLVEVEPEHKPDFEEARYLLEQLATSELMAERYSFWMEELTARYKPVLNYPLIDRLPPDPGEW
ncbi:MAG: peptidyl-prolyl cis-trans isomerase [Candidatus Aegiribacteria sp.]|nr:peptidyl-prolyl cis-trans isomerase [Candidatus Aegiribacteria sp.]